MRLGAFALAGVTALAGCGLVTTTMQGMVPPNGPRREPLDETPFVRSKASPDPRLGYVAGVFSRGQAGPGFAFIVVDALGNEHVLAFNEVNVKYGLALGEPGMIALPPGDYRVQYWAHPSRARNELRAADVLGVPFALRPGHVVFLGAFTATQAHKLESQTVQGTWWTTSFAIEHRPIAVDEARASLSSAYPAFAGASMECILCAPPSSAAAPSAAPALPQDGDFSPARDVVVHVRRTELHPVYDSYVGCRLIAWEVVAGTRARREVIGASRRAPLEPKGRDEYGVFWAVNDRNFRDGTAHVSVVCDGEDLRGLRDAAWKVAEAREVWIVEGEPTVYRSREEADRAHPPVQPERAPEEDEDE